MQAQLFNRDSVERMWAIEDVIAAYEAELDWRKEFMALRNKFRLRKDPSEGFITARKQKEFEQWYPVSHSMYQCLA